MPGIQWGYVVNQSVRRRDVQERAFKQISVCGFRGVELREGTGRFAPLGRPDLIEINFGSDHNLVEFLHSCGIDQIVSYFYNPGLASEEETWRSRFASNPADHDGILQSIRPFARFLQEVGGSRLVVEAMGAYTREAPLTDDKIKNAAECWNKVGKMAKEYGVQTSMHTDCLCAIHGMGDIEKLLRFTNPEYVGFTVDTAELIVTGVDPVDLYEKHHDRVNHFHFKGAHAVDALGEYKGPGAANLLNDGGQRGIVRWFYEMGRSGELVNFPALVKSMKAHRYQGWVMVENEQSPNPPESCMLNCWYTKNVLSKI
jgi:inosose dehydratase